MPTKDELAAELDAARAEVRALQDCLNSQANVAPPAPALVPQVLPNLPVAQKKVTTPNEYDSARDKADSFLKQLTLYFRDRAADFTSESDKIIFPLSYMKGGTARSWADQITKGILDGQNPYANFPAFQMEFKKYFSDPDAAATARCKLKLVHQGGQSVDEYTSEF